MTDISVIIPTYKPGDYIYKCLDSLGNQTLAAERYEIIVVVNGCNEPYLSAINDYVEGKHYPAPTRIIQTDTPGVSNARNVGIDNARGTYISFIDDDDTVSGNYLANLLALADEESIVHANVIHTDQKTGSRRPYFLTNAYNRCAGIESLSFFAGRSFLSSVCCKLIPRKAIGTERLDTSFTLGEDSLFVFQISHRIKNIRLASADTVYNVVYRETSASRRFHPYSFRVRLAFRLTWKYLMLFAARPTRYDFPFFLTRVAATLKKLFMKRYE